MDESFSGKVVEGRYRLDEMLGEGAMGAVYAGYQLAVDRKVAIKLLHPFLRRHDDFKARFELEAKALARLSHPNCITLFDFGYCEDIEAFYMVLEYIEGDLLADMMVDPMNYMDVLQIGYQVGLALDHAHGQGILHRDLKPENIMVQMSRGFPRVKVLDFGLAHLFATENEEKDEEPTTKRRRRLTKAGEIYGTPAYMSPEQCKGSRELTPSSDLYSFGILLFELFEGRLPFFADSPAEIMLKQLSDPAPEMTVNVEPEIRALIGWMLRKDANERPVEAAQVLEVLRRYVQLDQSQELGPDSGDWTRPRMESSGERPIVHTMLYDDDFEPSASADKEPVNTLFVIAAALIALLAIGFVGYGIVSSNAEARDVVTKQAGSVDPLSMTNGLVKVVDDAPDVGIEVDPKGEEGAELSAGKPNSDAGNAGETADAGRADVAIENPVAAPKAAPKKKRKKRRKPRKKKKVEERPKTLKLKY